MRERKSAPCFGNHRTTGTEVKFYNGIGSFSSFDNVALIREPSNPHDKNSVLVIIANKNSRAFGKNSCSRNSRADGGLQESNEDRRVC